MIQKGSLKSKVGFCENCNDEVEFEIKDVQTTVRVKGRELCAILKKAFCSKCGSPVFVSELNKINDLIVYDQYRKEMGLLTSEEIKKIRLKRNLSQEKMAELIKCGKKNIARYENGTIQDPVFDLLIRLLDDDFFYLKLVTYSHHL